MKYFALGLVAVLAMAGFAMADYTVDLPGVDAYAYVTETPLEYGKCAYDIHIYGTKSFEGLQVLMPDMTTLAPVHQVWEPTATPTPYQGMILATGVPQSPAAYDTHFLFGPSDITVATPSDSPLETNTQANENDLPQDMTWYYFEGVGYLYQVDFPGMGTFNSVGATQSLAFTFAGALDPDGYDLIHIVRECGQPMVDDMFFVGLHSQGAGPQEFAIPIRSTPEPATIALLLAGALCALGIRRR